MIAYEFRYHIEVTLLGDVQCCPLKAFWQLVGCLFYNCLALLLDRSIFFCWWSQELSNGLLVPEFVLASHFGRILDVSSVKLRALGIVSSFIHLSDPHLHPIVQLIFLRSPPIGLNAVLVFTLGTIFFTSDLFFGSLLLLLFFLFLVLSGLLSPCCYCLRMLQVLGLSLQLLGPDLLFLF